MEKNPHNIRNFHIWDHVEGYILPTSKFPKIKSFKICFRMTKRTFKVCCTLEKILSTYPHAYNLT